MKQLLYSHKVSWTALLLMLALSIPAIGQEAAFSLSKNRDFSTTDLAFERTDTLYIRVVRPDIDFTAIDEMGFRLKPEPEGPGLEGHFSNNFDGSYTASVALDSTDPAISLWQLKIEINDQADNEFNARIPLTIGAANGTPPPPGTGRELHVEGRISDINGNQLLVHDVWILVGDRTEISGDEEQTLTFADLFVGMEIDVRAIHMEDGRLLAKRIEAKIKDAVEGEVEVEGVITELDSASLVVDGLHFLVDANTEFRGRHERQTTFDSLSTGLFVGVKGSYQEDGTLLAERIKVDENEDRREDFTIAGPVDSLKDRKISVGGFDFLLDSETEFNGEDHLEIGRAALQVGALVEIKGEYRSDGLLWAVKIKLKETAGTEVEEHGNVEEVGDRTVTVNGIIFNVDSTTVFLDGEKQPIDFSAIQIDQEVEIRAIRFADGTLLALRIKVKKEKSERIKQKGRIEALTANTITVLSAVFSVDSTSQILDADKNPILFSDLQVDMLVKIRAVVNLDGSLFAEEVRMKERGGEEVSVAAAIDSLWDGKMSLGGLTFTVTEKSIILNALEEHIVFSDLQPGDLAAVKGKQMPDGTNLALRIRLRDQSDGFTEIEGSVTRVSGDTLVVGESVLFLNSDTQYFNKEDTVQVAAIALTVGDLIEVQAETNAEGQLIVLKLKLEEAASVQGTVENTGGSSPGKAEHQSPALASTKATQFTLVNTTVLVDANTLIVGSFNAPLDASVISSGAVVDVQGTLTSTGELLASSIQVLFYNLATSVNDQSNAATVPETFSLEQNYPNPFNPETTISFHVPSKSFVSIKIYNMLGQEIQTLVNSEFGAGFQTVHWNAQDRNGNNVSSGVYFYRIKAGNFRKVMKMTLVR